MGRPRAVFKKRKFTGNVHTRKSVSCTSGTGEVNLSTSRRKLDKLDTIYDSLQDDKFKTSGFRLIDLELLSAGINAASVCCKCKEPNTLSVVEDKREGIACALIIVCSFCEHNNMFYSSKKTCEGYFESNFRFAYGMRSIGKGRIAANNLCCSLNMPPPVARFDKLNSHVLKHVKETALRSMKRAASELVRDREEDCVLESDSAEAATDLSVSVDGTWMKRGHTSLYGVSSIISVDSGKVLDVQMLSKYCHECATRKSKESQWVAGHVCKQNYNGSSGGMEAAAVLQMFCRSLDHYGVRYINYLGDGDSKSFKTVHDNNPYDCPINKLECVGHIQKRVGTRLRRLLKENKGKKLSDGKPLGGKGRLTQKEIDSLQVYYGKAIRENTSSVEKMKNAIWAIYFNKRSTDDEPLHYLCPKQGWCKYNKDSQNYKHKHSLPGAVMTVIKQIFIDLSNKYLLNKCLHGGTQNNNESFNNLVWLRCPKTTFCGLKVLEIAVYDAVIHFNDGQRGKIDIFESAGLVPGVFTMYLCKESDKRRIEKAELSFSNIVKEARKRRRAKRKGVEDEEEDKSYECGNF